MKQIQVSNATYGLLWSLATEADRSEEDVLRRVLSQRVKAIHATSQQTALPFPAASAGPQQAGGLYDRRSGVRFPEGFRIYRNYKGHDHEAKVVNGAWRLDEWPTAFDSLSKLNHQIGAKTENVWVSWNYDDERGVARKITELRDPSKIVARSK